MVKMRSVGMGMSIAMSLLLLGTTAALAQTESQREAPEGAEAAQAAVGVNGTSTLVGQAMPGTTTLDGLIVRVRDNVLVTMEESSDPRVSGRARITVNFDAYPDETGLPGVSQVRFGEMRLENDEGAWEGRFAGSLANGGFVQTYWLESIYRIYCG